MKKNEDFLFKRRSLLKLILMAKLIVCFLMFSISGLLANTYSQSKKLTLNIEEASILDVFNEIEKQSEFGFFFKTDQLDLNKKYEVSVYNVTIDKVLAQVIDQEQYKVDIVDRNIVISKRDTPLTTELQQQVITITGIVTDDKNIPLPGVNIIEKGTSNGTITDLNGSFTINVTKGVTLQFSFVGMNPKEVLIEDQTELNVTLIPVLESVEEVVVTALGIKRAEKTLTYASQSVNSSDLDEAKETNVVNSLSGKVAGVQISPSATGPGGASRVIIRGNRSISGNNQPLYIVDGVPIDNTTSGTRGNDRVGDEPQGELGGLSRSDGISNISTDDIESINVLKGASAAALYGSRAANGVIIITTKSGSGKSGIGIDINSSVTFDQPIFLTKLQNTYGQGSDGAYLNNTFLNWGPKMEGQSVQHWSKNPADSLKQYSYTAHPNNYKDFYQTGTNVSTSVALNIGGDKVRSFISFTNTVSNGIVPTNDLKRNNFNIRVTSDITSKLSLDTKINYITQNTQNRPVVGEDFASVSRQVIRMPRNISLQDAEDNYYYINSDGNTRQNLWVGRPNGEENPYWVLRNVTRMENRDRVIGLLSLRYQFTNEFSLQFRHGLDTYTEKNEFKWYNNTYVIADLGRYMIDNNKVFESNTDFLASYNKEFQNLSVGINFGGNLLIQENSFQRTNSNRLRLENLFMTTNMVNPVTTTYPYEKQVQSLYGFAQIGFKRYLFLDITGRNDWSSTLPKDNMSFFYPSAGLTWVISDMTDLPSYFSFLKMRGSVAQVGNGAEPYLTKQYYTTDGTGTSRDPILPIEDLKPEITTSYEAGVDLRMFEDRFGIDFTYYKSSSKNQLLTVPLPSPSGWDFQFINAGQVDNQGVEIMLSLKPVKATNFFWDLDVNFAKNKNEVVKITDELDSYVLNSSYMVSVNVEEGKPFGELYVMGYKRDPNGRPIIGADGMPQLTNGKDVRVGNYNPDWTAGITNTFTYKNISLSFLIDIRQGGQVASFTNANLYGDGLHEGTLAGREGGLVIDGVLESGEPNNITVAAEDFWTKVGGRNTPVGELFTYDASNARLRQLTLGYSVPSSVFNDSFIKGVKLSFVGRNLFFLYNKAGDFDPDQTMGTTNAQGVEAFALPTTRSYGFNVKLSF